MPAGNYLPSMSSPPLLLKTGTTWLDTDLRTLFCARVWLCSWVPSPEEALGVLTRYLALRPVNGIPAYCDMHACLMAVISVVS